MHSLGFIFRYIKRHWVRYLAGIFTLFVVDFANIYIPRITGDITDGLAYRTFLWGDVLRCLVIIGCLGLTLAIGRFLWRHFLFGTSYMVEEEMRNDMFAHLETMDVEYYNENRTGDLMTRFSSDLNAIHLAIGIGAVCVFDALVMSVMVLVQMMTYVDARLTLVALIPMLVILCGELYYGKLMHTRYRERQEAVSALADFVQEDFSGIRVIKAFVRERAQLRQFAKENANTRDKTMRAVRLQSIVIPLLDVVIGCSTLAALIYGGYLTLLGDITLGRFVAFNQYINQLVWPMLACGEAVNTFSQGLASARRVQTVMESQTEVKDLPETMAPQAAAPLHGDITLNHLSFHHKDSETDTLQDINLKVPKGTTLAIVGRTGSGKSTLVNLLLRLYNVEPGMLFLDGRDINSIPLQTLRENIAYVPQDNFLFSETLRANISFGVEGEDLRAITHAAEEACIHESITSFPEGYNTIVGERGVTLSGGQKQRSSIARALMKDAPILILDDSLSAVDTDTEEQILKNLKQNRQGKTTILIAHRISTVQNADIIMVLENGMSQEVGSHAELMEKGGLYRDMFEKQQLEAAVGERQAALRREAEAWKGGELE